MADERRKELEFITNAHIRKVLAGVKRRLTSNRSALILGEYGTGKSRILRELIKGYQGSILMMSGLGSVTQLLGEMAGETEIKIHKKQQYLKELKLRPRIVFMDEGQDQTREIFPYLKLLIDQGNRFVIAGRPTLADRMADAKCEDVLSRFQTFSVIPLLREDIRKALPDFDEEAASLVHGMSKHTRGMEDLIFDCRDYAKEAKLKTITADIVEKIYRGEI